MADNKRYPTKYTGVVYRVNQQNEKVYYIRYKINSKVFEEKVGIASSKVTAVFCNKLRAKKISDDKLEDDSPYKEKDNSTSITFDELAKEFFHKNNHIKSINQLKGRYINHIRKYLGKYKLNNISSEMIEDFRIKMKEKSNPRNGLKYSTQSTNNWVMLIGRIYNYGIKKKKLQIKNPYLDLDLKQEPDNNTRERYLTYEEINELWTYIEKRGNLYPRESTTMKLKLFVGISLSTGARLRSVLTIKKSDINLEQNLISLYNYKSDRAYHGYINPMIKPLIEKRLEKLKPFEYVVSGTSKPLSSTAIENLLKPIFDNFNEHLDESDRKNRVVVHTLRHTFASLLAIQGTPIYTIMKLMNHSDMTQTIRYAKLSPDSGVEDVTSLKFNLN